MSYQATVINVMIASPGDVASERQLIQTLIHDWNSLNAEEYQTVLMPITWETHSTPEMGDRAQSIINRQVLERCDLLVAVFWTRLGSPTGTSPSGTVEEIRKHVAAGKPAMIYFSKNPVALDSVDIQQYESLKNFRSECEANGLISTYDNLHEFGHKFNRHLMQVTRECFRETSDLRGEGLIVSAVLSGTTLSDEAKRLLVAAADSDGTVMRVLVMEGTIIQAGGQQMAEMGDRRDEARWEAALQELVERGLLEPRGHKGEVFAVTNRGYEQADILKQK